MNVKRAMAMWLLSVMAIPVVAQDATKYEIKSAIIQKEITTMGQKFNATWYIDDFGQKESVDMTMNGMHVRTMMIDDAVVTVDMDLKVTNKTVLPEKPINYRSLTTEIKEKYKIKETGEEEIAGKRCQKYSLEIAPMGQTVQARTWVWKGLVLKSEMESNGMVVSIEVAIEVQENAIVPEDVFTVPE
jgi:hypothetical protein